MAELSYRDVVEIRGHIIDSNILSAIMGEIMDRGGEFDVQTLQVGRQREDPSYARLEIRASSQDAIQVEHGSLYPALHRLERRGWLAAEWKISEANRRARYYRLTPRGRKRLLEEQSKWRLMVRAVARTMKPVGG